MIGKVELLMQNLKNGRANVAIKGNDGPIIIYEYKWKAIKNPPIEKPRIKKANQLTLPKYSGDKNK